MQNFSYRSQAIFTRRIGLSERMMKLTKMERNYYKIEKTVLPESLEFLLAVCLKCSVNYVTTKQAALPKTTQDVPDVNKGKEKADGHI